MDPITAFLLSMQAAGLVIGLNESRTKQGLINQGRQLEKAALDTNLEALNLEYNESSINAMRQLRANLGTQIATNAARGTRQGAGTSLSQTTRSISNYNSDEQARRMNMLAKEANLRANNVLSGLHTLESETQLGRETAKMFEAIPASSAFDRFSRTSLGKKWGFGLQPAEA